VDIAGEDGDIGMVRSDRLSSARRLQRAHRQISSSRVAGRHGSGSAN